MIRAKLLAISAVLFVAISAAWASSSHAQNVVRSSFNYVPATPYYSPYGYGYGYGPTYYPDYRYRPYRYRSYRYPRIQINRTPTQSSTWGGGHSSQYFGNPHASQYFPR